MSGKNPDLLALLEAEEESPESLSLQVVEGILGKNYSFLDVVEGLGKALTDSNQLERIRGVNILSIVLKELPRDHLSSEELKVVVDFFCVKAGDQFVVGPSSLGGFLALLKMTRLPENSPESILRSLRTHLTCQALPQPSRFIYFSILDELLTEHTEAMQKISEAFVHTVIVSMESESDPRNLTKIFSLLPRLFRAFKIQDEMVEEAFGVLECYFPVDYVPRETADITRDDLAEGLEVCLLSTPVFGPFIIPMLLDKLDSRLKVAHVDSLKVLMKGAQIWDVECLCSNLAEFEKILKGLIFPGSDPEVTELATKSVVSLVARLSKAPSNVQQQESLNQLLEFILGSTHTFIRDASLSMFLPSMKVLSEVAWASSSSCYYVVSNVLNQIMTLLSLEGGNHTVVLSAFQSLLASTVHFQLWNIKDDTGSTSLQVIPGALIGALARDDAASGCYLCLAEIASCLSEDQRKEIYDFIISSTPRQNNPHVRESCAKYVKTVAGKFPEEANTLLLSRIVLPSDDSLLEAETGRSIELICWVCHVLSLTPLAISKILSFVTSGSRVTPIALSCLSSLCSELEDKAILHSLGIRCQLPQKLLTCWLEFLSNPATESLCTPENLGNVAKIVNSIMRSLESDEQSSVVKDSFLLFGCKEGQKLGARAVLLEGLMGSLRREVLVPEGLQVILSLTDVAIEDEDRTVRLCASRLLASIVNKYEEDSELEEALSSIKQKISLHREAFRVPEAASLTSWVAKSLVLRADPRMNQWLDMMINDLLNEATQMIAVDGFKLILTDSDYYLDFKSYCVIKILYKQRVLECVTKLVPLLETTEGTTRQAVSLAIGHFLGAAPRQVLLAKMKELMPVMVSCIDGGDPLVVCAVLEVVGKLLADEEEIMADYIQTFVPRCIEYSKYALSMQVRINALDCLYLYGRYKEDIVLPYKSKVIQGIQECLDDKKRLVRRKAVHARTAWFLLGSLTNKGET